jgi:hypothetical protein
MTHPNGSHVEGYVVKPNDKEDYAHYRDIGPYCPFPTGGWSSIGFHDAEGVGTIKRSRSSGRPTSVCLARSNNPQTSISKRALSKPSMADLKLRHQRGIIN